MNITLTILNMDTEEDFVNIWNRLEGLPGVTAASFKGPKKLTLTFNPNKVSLNYVVYEITRAGYRLLSRG